MNTKKPMKKNRILFCGTPEFAIPTLERLHEMADVALVLSMPDRPRNRGVVTPTPVKQAAERMGIEVWTPANVNDPEIVSALAAYEFDFIVEVAFGRLLKPAFLNLAPNRVLNVHPSLLPAYRGAAPLVWPILNGDEETGLCIMLVDEGMDTGDVLERITVPLGEKTASELHDELALIGADATVRVIADYERYYENRTPQTGLYTYAKKITKEMGHLDFQASGDEILRKIRALNPWPGTYVFLNGNRMQVLAAEIVPRSSDTAPGIVYKADETGIYTNSMREGIRITEIKPGGKRAMKASDYLRGNPIAVPQTLE